MTTDSIVRLARPATTTITQVAKIGTVITTAITHLIAMGMVPVVKEPVHVLKVDISAVVVIHLLSEVCLSRHRFIAFLVNREFEFLCFFFFLWCTFAPHVRDFWPLMPFNQPLCLAATTFCKGFQTFL